MAIELIDMSKWLVGLGNESLIFIYIFKHFSLEDLTNYIFQERYISL